MTGKIMSHYEILEELGRGGMGVVYKARDTRLNRTVALKLLPEQINKDETAKARFLQEARVAAALNHPHICTVHGVEDHDDSLFIVMEYVDGGTLRERIPFKNAPDALTIAIQIGEALHEAHSHGVIHRDIKADNIMLTVRGDVKIMDFGLARLKGVLKLTRSSSTVGTLGYMAPEQIQGGEADPRSDIFSFGVLLFEMLTGRLPFRGEHEAAMMYSILNEQPESLKTFIPDVSESLVRIVEKALEKDPGERYQTAADLVADLKRSKRDSSRVSFNDFPTPRTSRVSPFRRALKNRIVITGIVLAALLAAGLFVFQPFESAERSGRKTLVVLPFTNQSEPDREYFADGIAEEITTRLSSLSGIGVIARASAWQYKGTAKSVKQIGTELDVDYVLMGTVRWSPQSNGSLQVRVRPELIDVHSGLQVWGNTFDASFQNAFALQTDIAQQVAHALDLKLLTPEASALGQGLTSVPEAYDFYLQGLDYESRSPSHTDAQIAIQHYERAVSLDPAFAAAHARLAKVHAQLYWFFYDRTSARVERSRRAAEKALTLAPHLSASHEAMAWHHYHTRLDYDAAIQEFTRALELQPNNAGVSYGLAAVFRRKGQMEESLEHWRAAIAGNPRDAEIIRQAGETLDLLRRYEEAQEQYKIAGRLAPDNVSIYFERARSLILWKGDLVTAEKILQDGERFGRPSSGEDEGIKYLKFRIAMMKNRLDVAKQAAEAFVSEQGQSNQFVFYPKALLLAQIEELRNPELARRLYQRSIRVIQESLRSVPDDERAHSALGIAYAGLGRHEDAIQEGERGISLLPVEREAWRGSSRLIDMAHIYTLTGDHEKAVDVLERLLSIPSELSRVWLRLDSRWVQLRNNKRFQALIR